jgi:hypothetical protein
MRIRYTGALLNAGATTFVERRGLAAHVVDQVGADDAVEQRNGQVRLVAQLCLGGDELSRLGPGEPCEVLVPGQRSSPRPR